MRVGVVGSGFGSRVVAPVFAATPGCEVVDVVSARDDAATHALVTRRDVDLVSVHSPPFLHAAHVRAALGAGKAVLCDKPFAMDAAEAAALETEAVAAAVPAFCNFEFRFAPARQSLRELVRDGTLGRIEHVQWTHLSAGSRVPLRPWGWLFDRALGGGWIGAWASHAVDTLRFMIGEVVDVQSRPRIAVTERPDADGVMHACTAEDGFTASLVLASGVTVAIDSSFAAAANVAPRLTVFGSDAVAELTADARLVVRRAGGAREEVDVPSGMLTDWGDPHLVPMQRLAAALRAAVEDGDPAPELATFADGRACDAVLERLRPSQV